VNRATGSQSGRPSVEELANSLTHGVGLVLSVTGMAVLVALAVVRGTLWHVIGCCVFGASLVALYGASTLYHWARAPHRKRVLKVVDHAAIYLLIAGTYTPFTLVNLRGPWGWTLFGVIWTLSLTGIAVKVYHVNRFPILSPTVYMMMGWLGVVALKPLAESISTMGLIWLLAGGVFYSTGVIFYALKRVPFNHAIWHLFVLAGSICHYLAVLVGVVPSHS
jgi:hemolysin III